MFKIKHFIVIFLLFFMTLGVLAQDYTVHKLPNGQTVIVYEIHNNPIVTIDTWIKTGTVTVQAGIPVSTAGSPTAQTGATTGPGTGTIS